MLHFVYGEVSGAQVEYQQRESNRWDYLIVHGPMVSCSIGMNISQSFRPMKLDYAAFNYMCRYVMMKANSLDQTTVYIMYNADSQVLQATI